MARNCSSSANYLTAFSIPSGSQPPVQSNGNTGTFSLWFSPSWSSGDGVWHELFEFYNSGSNQHRLEGLKFSDNNFYVGLFNNGTDQRLSFADTGLISANSWVNLIVTYTIGGNCQVFINGVSKGTKANTALVAPLNTFRVGSDDGVSSSISAFVADAALWNVVLGSTDIANILAGVRPNSVQGGSLIGWWPMDGYASPETDLSGNGNSLTLTGPPARVLGPPALWRISA